MKEAGKGEGRNSRIEDEERAREVKKGSRLVFMCFNRINKDILRTGLVKRRPSMMGGGRGWQPEARENCLGKK